MSGVAPLIEVGGLRTFQRKLTAMGGSAPAELRKTIKAAVQPMLTVAKERANEHRQSGELADRWFARVSGSRAAIVNTLPQANPLEFGGTIAPKGAPIKLPVVGMIYGPGGAIERGKEEVERRLVAGFDAFAGRFGWK